MSVALLKIPSPLKVVQVITKINRINSKSEYLGGPAVCGYHRNRVRATRTWKENVLTRQFCLKRTLLLDRLAGFVVSLTRPSHSQERVWYFTVQLIVLADSGCRVYTRSHSTQTTYTFGGEYPTKVVGSGTNRCIVKYQTLSPCVSLA